MHECKPTGARIINPITIDKRWGHERIFINGESTSTDGKNRYCMKEIYIHKGSETSSHIHCNKHECLYVAQGPLTLEYLDGVGSNILVEIINTGETLCVPPGFVHRLKAIDNDVLIIEASTPDSPDDSFRISM